MRESTKQVLFLVLFALSLAVVVAIVSWRMNEARRERPLPPPAAAPTDSP
jgi:hypothetical protein